MAVHPSNYIDKKLFAELIMVYKKTGSKTAYNKIGKIFLTLAWNILRNPCFNSYTKDRKDEMVENAAFIMSKRLNDYDPTYIPNPFSYFTTTTYRAIIQKINEQKKRDKNLKSISYIENLEQRVYTRSTLFNTRMPESDE